MAKQIILQTDTLSEISAKMSANYDELLRMSGDPTSLYNNEQAMTRFMSLMNEKAAIIGMNDSVFVDCYGGSGNGYNVSTAKDLLRLLIYASGYPVINDVWSTRSATVRVFGPNARTAVVTNTAAEGVESAYSSLHSGDTMPYRIIGIKLGGWTDPQAQRSYACGLIAEVEGHTVAVMVQTDQGNGTTGRQYRLYAAVEVLDICAAYFRNEDISQMNATYAVHAAAAEIPAYPITFKASTLAMIYKKAETGTFNPASMTKILACCVVLDISQDLYEVHRLSFTGTSTNTEYTPQSGDIESTWTSLMTTILASSGVNTLCLALYLGKKVLAQEGKYSE